MTRDEPIDLKWVEELAEAREVKRINALRVAQRIRVPAGFVLAPLVLVLARPSWTSLAGGSVLAVCGLAIRAWASCYIRKNEVLATSGPYAYTRNPLYLGTFLLGLGVAVAAGNVWIVVVFAILYLAIYIPVILAEADTMRRLFPEAYDVYSRKVPMFVPRVTAYQSAATAGDKSEGTLDLSLYREHREYRAAIGFLMIAVFLIIRIYY